jgi:hypothetical protein
MQQVVAARCSERDIYGDGGRIVKPSLEEETTKIDRDRSSRKCGAVQ